MNEDIRQKLQEAISLVDTAIEMIDSDKTLPHNTAVYAANRLITVKITLGEVHADV